MSVTIPTRMEAIFTTSLDNQTSVYLDVYEGERIKASENYYLGTVSLTGLPMAPKGFVRMKLCFKIDSNGILTVLAEDICTGN